jgi:glycosyltransferase involved in cell wall biosynthesis
MTVAASVIVPVRNGMPWLDEQLAAIVAQRCDAPWEVLVVDNGSTDGSAACAQAWAGHHPALRVVDAPEARGAAGARNHGATVADGRFLLFCDADDTVAPGWVAAFLRALERADVVAGTFAFGAFGAAPRAPVPAATGQLGFLPAALGANLGVRRSAFGAVGGFREDLAVGEDIDLCWRLQLDGFHFAVADDAVVAKRNRGSPWATFRRSLAYGRSDVTLFVLYRRSGMRRQLRRSLRSWAWLLVHVPALARPGPTRDDWAHAAGVRVGRLWGSLASRTFFP